MPSIYEQIFSLEDKRVEAMIKKDIEILETFLADDMVYIHAFGQIDDRTTWLQNIEGHASRYISFDRSDVNICISENMIAVVTAKVALVGELNGIRMELTNVITTTWAQLKYGWKVILSQSTPVVQI